MSTEPFALQRGDGHTYEWNGYHFTFKVRPEDSDGRFFLSEFVCETGQEPSTHVHEDEDEIFYVLEGSLAVHCGDRSFDLEPLGCVFLPRGIPHGFTITSDGEVRMLVMTSPANFGKRIQTEGRLLD